MIAHASNRGVSQRVRRETLHTGFVDHRFVWSLYELWSMWPVLVSAGKTNLLSRGGLANSTRDLSGTSILRRDPRPCP